MHKYDFKINYKAQTHEMMKKTRWFSNHISPIDVMTFKGHVITFKGHVITFKGHVMTFEGYAMTFEGHILCKCGDRSPLKSTLPLHLNDIQRLINESR